MEPTASNHIALFSYLIAQDYTVVSPEREHRGFSSQYKSLSGIALVASQFSVHVGSGCLPEVLNWQAFRNCEDFRWHSIVALLIIPLKSADN